MAAAQTLSGLARFPARVAGSESERRAASWLSAELRRAGLIARTETFWCRPNWALAHGWHVALGLAGSLVSTSSPGLGGALILVALLSVFADALLGSSLGRRLTPERASQNVVSSPPPGASQDQAIRLIITAGYDTRRSGLLQRVRLRRAARWMGALTGGRAPGWLAWLTVLLLWLEAAAVMRLQGATGAPVGVVQLLPTVLLVVMLALLLEQGTAGAETAAAQPGSGAATAVVLAQALAARPPRNCGFELVLQGAADAGAIGLRRFLRARRRRLGRANAIVLGICASAAGGPRWWISDGQLIPVRYFAQLRRLATNVAAQAAQLNPRPVRTRGCSPALPAALARIPALAVGSSDQLASVVSIPTTEYGHSEQASIDQVVEFSLLLVDAIDDFLGSAGSNVKGGAPAPASPTPV